MDSIPKVRTTVTFSFVEFLQRRWPVVVGVLAVVVVGVIVAVVAGSSGGSSDSSLADQRAALEAKLTASTKRRFPPAMRTAAEAMPQAVALRDCEAPTKADDYFTCHPEVPGADSVGIFITPFGSAAEVDDQLDFAADSKASTSGRWHDSTGELRGRAVRWSNSSKDTVISWAVTVDGQRYVVDAYWGTQDQEALLAWWEKHSSPSGVATFTPANG